MAAYSLFELANVSGSLGSLVAGIVLSGHPVADRLSGALISVRELLLVAFFIEIGLGGLTLVNYSEFGLIVIAVGVENGALAGSWTPIMAIAVAASFVAGSGLVSNEDRILPVLARWIPPVPESRLIPDERPVRGSRGAEVMRGASSRPLGLGEQRAEPGDALLRQPRVGTALAVVHVEAHAAGDVAEVLDDPLGDVRVQPIAVLDELHPHRRAVQAVREPRRATVEIDVRGYVGQPVLPAGDARPQADPAGVGVVFLDHLGVVVEDVRERHVPLPLRREDVIRVGLVRVDRRGVLQPQAQALEGLDDGGAVHVGAHADESTRGRAARRGVACRRTAGTFFRRDWSGCGR